ncbi:hypothetical protein STEG23_016641 [Scotinomys teguina]
MRLHSKSWNQNLDNRVTFDGWGASQRSQKSSQKKANLSICHREATGSESVPPAANGSSVALQSVTCGEVPGSIIKRRTESSGTRVWV